MVMMHHHGVVPVVMDLGVEPVMNRLNQHGVMGAKSQGGTGRFGFVADMQKGMTSAPRLATSACRVSSSAWAKKLSSAITKLIRVRRCHSRIAKTGAFVGRIHR